MKTALLLLIVLVAGAMIWLRLQKTDAAVFHQRPVLRAVGDYPGPNSFGAVVAAKDPGIGDLARLAALIQDTPRTRGLAGSLEDRHLSFVTRSAFWRFPDVTNIALIDGHLLVEGRARYGTSDFGVNRTRIQTWLQALRQP